MNAGKKIIVFQSGHNIIKFEQHCFRAGVTKVRVKYDPQAIAIWPFNLIPALKYYG